MTQVTQVIQVTQVTQVAQVQVPGWSDDAGVGLGANPLEKLRGHLGLGGVG